MINNLVFRNVPPEARDLCRFSLDADKSLSDDDREFCREESCERTFAIGISRLGQTSRHVHAIVHAYFRWKYRNLGLRDSLNRIPSTFLLEKKSIFAFSSTRFPSKDLLSFVINIYMYVYLINVFSKIIVFSRGHPRAPLPFSPSNLQNVTASRLHEGVEIISRTVDSKISLDVRRNTEWIGKVSAPGERSRETISNFR